MMHIKYGLKSTLRRPAASMLTLLLFLLVMTLLGSTLGMTRAVGNTLEQLSQRYTTIAVAELEGEAQDSGDRFLKAQETLSRGELPPGAISWSSEPVSQAFLPQAKQVLDNFRSSDYGVVLLKTQAPGAFSTRDTLPASALEVLFSVKNAVGKNLEVYGEGMKPEKTYLVYGRWYIGVLGVDLDLEALTPPLEIPDPEHWQDTPGAEAYLHLARELEVRRNSAMALAPLDPEAHLAFQQGYVQLSQGRMFTLEELAQSGKVCLISETLAKLEDLSLGDTLPLSLAPGQGTEVYSSYDPEQGFALEADFTVAGILRTKEAWKYGIFIPPQEGLRLSGANNSGILGQFRLENDSVNRFLAWSESNLPAGVHVTVYDQGYGEAAEPLRVMLRTVTLITLVSAAVSLSFLILNLWLFVNRQKRAILLMLRLGASEGGSDLYLLSGLLPLLLPALGLGVWVSRWVAGAVTAGLAETLRSSLRVSGLYSNARLTLDQTAALIQQPPSLKLFLLLAGITLILSLGGCLWFRRRTLSHHRQRSAGRPLQSRARTHPLTGGSIKYAWLSARRGGFRSAVTLLAPLLAALLFCGLQLTSRNTAEQLRHLEENTTIRGYFTNLYGSSPIVATVRYLDLFPVADLPQTVSATVTEQNNYTTHIVGKVVDDKLTGTVDYPVIPYSEFATNRIAAYDQQHNPGFCWTNSMEDVPQTMFRSAAVQWLEGWSNEDLAYVLPEAGQPGDEYGSFWMSVAPLDSPEAEEARVKQIIQTALDGRFLQEAGPCVISSTVAKAYDLALGDCFLCSATGGGTDNAGVTSGYIDLRKLFIVGIYPGTSPRDPIFLRANHPLGIGPDAQTLRELYGERVEFFSAPRGVWEANGVSMTDWAKAEAPSSAVFRFRADDLEGLKQALADLGLTQVEEANGTRKPFLLEDQVFLATKRSIEQRLWYMERIFPVIQGLALFLAVLLSTLQTLARRREIWLMHSVGTGRAQSFGNLYLEQAGLSALGTGLGLWLCRLLGWENTLGKTQTICFLGLWVLSAGVTGLLMILRPKRIGRDE